MVPNSITEIDIVFLSYGYTDNLQQMTIDCIQSLLASEDHSRIKFNIVVVESNCKLNNYQYPYTTTIYPTGRFNLNRYLNLGIDKTKSGYVCLCHTDLVFHQKWASEILKCMVEIPDLLSASPISSKSNHDVDIPLNSGNKSGYRLGYEIADWCLFVRRNLFRVIGKLDESIEFNACGYDYANILGMLDLKHFLITSSIVDHLNNEASISFNYIQEQSRTFSYYNYKWRHRILLKEL